MSYLNKTLADLFESLHITPVDGTYPLPHYLLDRVYSNEGTTYFRLIVTFTLAESDRSSKETTAELDRIELGGHCTYITSDLLNGPHQVHPVYKTVHNSSGTYRTLDTIRIGEARPNPYDAAFYS